MKPIVKVTWLDACSGSGWQNEPTAPSATYTIGYLVYSDDDFMQVACTYDPNSGYWNGAISIPQDNVITYEVINNGDEEETELEITFEAE